MSQAVTASSAVPQSNNATYGATAAASGGAGTGGTGSGTTFLVPKPPPALSALATGQIVRAVAAGQTADGQTLVDTRFGQFPIKLPFTPERGEVLRLQIVQTGDPTKLTILDKGSAEAAKSNTATPRVGDLVTVRGTHTAPAGTGAAPAPNGATATTEFQARIVWLAAGKPDTGAGRSDIIAGRVLSSPPNGPTLVQTAAGRVSLPGVGNLQPGIDIGMRPVGNPAPPAPGGMPGPAPAALTSLGTAWTALEDVHAILNSANANAATPLAPNAIPTTGPQLATGMLFFMNALFQGSVQEWLGREAMRVLAEGDRQGLVRRLSDDFSQLSRLSAEPQSGEWRMAILPLLDENSLQQIRLYIRQLEGDGADGETPGGTRFVVEASLSRIGALQLDGFVRPARFDLMVRTHDALPAHMREDISLLFAEANREFGATGRIDFRVENPFGVQPGEPDTNAPGVYA